MRAGETDRLTPCFTKPFLTLLLVLSGFILRAQQPLDRVRPLLDAEEAFAEMAKRQNTRDAFIHFFTDSVVTAPPGRGPVKGKQHLQQQTQNASWLNWWPSMSQMAFSGDFGFNTGPWEFRPERSDEKPIACGQFLSVWKKEAHGEWRVALDMGISHSMPSNLEKGQVLVTTSASSGRRQTLFEIERKLVKRLNESQEKVYQNLLSTEARFLRSGLEPLTAEVAIEQQLAPSSNAVFSFLGGEIASTGDLAYTYGSVTFAGTPNSTHPTLRTYARIWKKESDGWKIVVDLISD